MGEKDFSFANEREYEAGKKKGKSIGYNDGYNNGYIQGMNDWAIGIPCWKCNKTLYIKPNSTDYNETRAEMKGRLKHDTCPRE